MGAILLYYEENKILALLPVSKGEGVPPLGRVSGT